MGIRGLNVNFLFSNPEKAHPCAKPRQGRRLWAVGRARKKEAQ